MSIQLIIMFSVAVDVALGGVHGHSGDWNYDSLSKKGTFTVVFVHF